MTKAKLARILVEKDAQPSRARALAAVDSILTVLKAELARERAVRITNFGSFEVVSRRARRGRDPVTGRIVDILPRRTLVFRTSKSLEQRLHASGTRKLP